LGAYYNDRNFNQLIQVREDRTINFTWGQGRPASGVSPDTFSVRWTGEIEPLYTERYTFYLTTDDGARLWIDGQQIINSWVDQSGDIERRGSVNLVAGRRYEIRLEYFENEGDARITLRWSSPRQNKQVVPRTALHPAAAPFPTVTPSPTRTPRPTRTPTTIPLNVDTYTIEVSAQDYWTGTDIEIEIGQRVSITYLRGRWSWRSCCSHNAEPSGSPFDAGYGVSAPIGTLIGRVGVSGRTMAFGNSYTFISQTNGELVLMINDTQSGLGDNTGSITVRVEVETP
jgi:hypothetical protein